MAKTTKSMGDRIAAEAMSRSTGDPDLLSTGIDTDRLIKCNKC